MRVASHYKATDDGWMPLDPSGRVLARHLAAVAVKAHAAAAAGVAGGACGGPAAATAAAAGSVDEKQRPSAKVGRPLLPAVAPDKGSSDSLQCVGVRSSCSWEVSQHASCGPARPAGRRHPQQHLHAFPAVGGGRHPAGTQQAAGRRQHPAPAAVEDEAAATLQACEALRRQWVDGVLTSLARAA